MRHPDASRKRIGDLTFTARQRKSWAAYALRHGRKAEAEAHQRKHLAAVAALKTLGVEYTD